MGSSPGRMCRHCTLLKTWAFISLYRLVGATGPLPSCSVPHGALCKMASIVGRHWTVLLEVLLRRCFQLRLPCLSMNLSWIHGRLQSFGSMRPLQGILPNKILLVIHRTGIGRWIRITYRTALHILLYKGTLLAHKVSNHLRCWFVIMLTLLDSMLLFRTIYWARLAQS